MNSKLLRLSALSLVAAVMAVVSIVAAGSEAKTAGHEAQAAAEALGVQLSAGFSDFDVGQGRSAAQIQGRRTGSISAAAMLGDSGVLMLAMAAVAVLILSAHPRRTEPGVGPAPRGPPLA